MRTASHHTTLLLKGQEDELQRAVDHLLAQRMFYYDVETVGEHRGVPVLNTVTWMAITGAGCDLVIPMGHPIGFKQIGRHKEPRQQANGIKMFWVPDWEEPPAQMERARVFDLLRPLFLDDRIIKVAHNQAFDAVSVEKYFGELPHPPYDDTMVREQLINENLLGKYGLKEIIRRRFGVTYDTENVGKCVESFPMGKVAHYSYMDTHMGYLVYQAQAPELAREYHDDDRAVRLERDLMGPLYRMRLHGAPVDVPRLHDMQDELSTRLITLEADVYKAAGKRFNINSPAQRAHILYDPRDKGGQGLEGWKLTAGGKKQEKAGLALDSTCYSTDDETLESYPDNPLAIALRRYGDTYKLLSTYVEGWLGVEGNKKKPAKIFDGRIHTSFNQMVSTGRMSSSSPNLQNIPRPDDEDGKLIRGAILAPEGWRLVVADYGQIELVIMAHFIGHGALFDGFLKGVDPHVVNAAMALNEDLTRLSEAVKAGDPEAKAKRQKYGKTLGFAMGFGAGTPKVASMIGCTLKRAKTVLRTHERMMPEVYEYKEHVWAVARKRKPPHLKTLLGHIRRLPWLNSTVQWMRARAERQAFNSLIQGSAADLIKLAIIRADRMLMERCPRLC